MANVLQDVGDYRSLVKYNTVLLLFQKAAIKRDTKMVLNITLNTYYLV